MSVSRKQSNSRSKYNISMLSKVTKKTDKHISKDMILFSGIFGLKIFAVHAPF